MSKPNKDMEKRLTELGTWLRSKPVFSRSEQSDRLLRSLQVHGSLHKRAVWRWSGWGIAACGVFVIVVSWYLLAGPGITPSAYAELVRAVEYSLSLDCVHISEMEYDGKEIDGDWIWTKTKKKASECWISCRPHRRCTVSPNGQVCFYDYPNSRSYDYDPESNEVWVRYEMPRDGGRISPFDKLPEGPGVMRRTGEIDGKNVIVFLMESDHDSHVRLWVDPETRLLVQSEKVRFGRKWRRLRKYDYPKPAPADIYALGVPRNAKVIKRLPTPEVEQLVENRIKARKALPKSYFSIECKLLESFAGDLPRLQPNYEKDTRLYYGHENNPESKATPGAVVTVTYYRAPNARIEKYPIWQSESYRGPQQREQLRKIVQTIPANSLSSLERWTKDKLPSQIIIFEKRHGGYCLHFEQGGALSSLRLDASGDDRAEKWLRYLNMDFWYLGSPWPKASDGEQYLGREPGPWGALTGISSQNSRAKFYFNPARDYICERIWADLSGKDAKWRGHGHTRSVLEYARTSKGRWYPRRTRIGWDDASYLVVHYVDDTRTFDGRLFELNSISTDDLTPLESK